MGLGHTLNHFGWCGSNVVPQNQNHHPDMMTDIMTFALPHKARTAEVDTNTPYFVGVG